jgi:hypothetical protein
MPKKILKFLVFVVVYLLIGISIVGVGHDQLTASYVPVMGHLPTIGDWIFIVLTAPLTLAITFGFPMLVGAFMWSVVKNPAFDKDL